MTFKITDAAGRPRTFLELGTACALAVGPIEVTAEDGSKVMIDPAKIDGSK